MPSKPLLQNRNLERSGLHSNQTMFSSEESVSAAPSTVFEDSQTSASYNDDADERTALKKGLRAGNKNSSAKDSKRDKKIRYNRMGKYVRNCNFIRGDRGMFGKNGYYGQGDNF